MKHASTLTLAAALMLVPGAGRPVAQTPQPEVTAFTGARLVTLDPKPTVTDVVILVKDGRIAEVGPPRSISVPDGAVRVNLDGRFVLPGFISGHVHVSDVAGPDARAYTDENTARQLGVFVRYGITTVLSLGGEQAPAFRARAAEAGGSPSALHRSRLLVAGDIVTAATADAARDQVARVAEVKPDWIKIRVDDNLGTTSKMPPDVYRAVIDEAHRRRLRVATHLYYLADAKALLEAGADFLAHSVRDTAVDDAFVSALKASSRCYTPTLMREVSTFVYESTPDFFADPLFKSHANADWVATLITPERQASTRANRAAQQYKAQLPVAMQNAKRLLDAGVPVVMGTDTGPMGRFQGYFELMELEMMVRGGFTPVQALASATSVAARCMGLDRELGSLEPGKWADFVVLEADPARDIANIHRIHSVWIAANRVTR
jgi:imidazolonepropionase-like amidohydrolase